MSYFVVLTLQYDYDIYPKYAFLKIRIRFSKKRLAKSKIRSYLVECNFFQVEEGKGRRTRGKKISYSASAGLLDSEESEEEQKAKSKPAKKVTADPTLMGVHKKGALWSVLRKNEKILKGGSQSLLKIFTNKFTNLPTYLK